jgi:DNA-binding SARP family transcriptional activator/tetratricopeptide (TPR) repeat protein
MAVDFRLLGDIAVVADGRVVDAGHARQRCVLAALLVDVDRAVPTDQLIDRVWAAPPQRARNALYNYVSRLRRVLTDAGEVDIVRRSHGYQITADPLAVDLYRFHHLVRQARAADADETASELFAQAFALWRGAAFGELDTPWINMTRNSCDSRRFAAELDRNDVELRLGRHATLLDDLSARSAAFPFDERLGGQLIVALYRSGRQADALRHYHRIRHNLAEHLGVDPGPPLQELHQRMLAAAPDLTPAPTGTDLRPATTPRQLPNPPRSFVGRARELAELDAVLATDRPAPVTAVVSAVSGSAGVGKTALAMHWAHRVADRFPDGQLYVNLRGFDPSGSVMDPGEALRRFLDALAVPATRIPVDLDAQAALYRTRVAGTRMLIVLDNARDTAQIRPLLPGTPGCVVLVTSRNQLPGLIASDGAHPLALDLLTDDEAQQLLARRIGYGRTAAEPEAVTEIITRCARLPLALALVAARAALRPRIDLQVLAVELRDAEQRWEALTGDDDPNTDLRTVFSWSYQALTPAAARLFRLLGPHCGPDITAPAAASLAGVPAAAVRPLLDDLTRASLLAEQTAGRYTLHDLLRAYATQLTHNGDTDQQRDAAAGRILDHYVHTAYTAARLLFPARKQPVLTAPRPGVTAEHLTGHEQAMGWFAAEHRVLLAAIDHAAATGFDTHTWQLAWALTIFLGRRGHWHDEVTAGRAAVAAAGRMADATVQSRAHRNLADAYSRLDRFDDADIELRHALALATQAGDHAGQAHTHYRMAVTLGHRDQPARALHHARRSLALHQTTADRPGLAYALNAVGWFLVVLGDHQQALAHCRQALALHQKTSNRTGQAATLDSLGYAHHHLGHHARAITCYQRAIAVSRDLGDRYEEASTLTHLGDTHHVTGNVRAARDAWRQALTTLTDLDHTDAEGVRAKLVTLDAATDPAVRQSQPS